MANALVVLSGGLDSSVVAYFVKKKVKPKKAECLFFNYGQRGLKEELFCAKKVSSLLNFRLNVVDMRWLGEISTALLNKKSKMQRVTVKDLGDIQKEKRSAAIYWVPCRNALFLLSALAYAESLYIKGMGRYAIFSGIKKEGRVPMKDTTPIFIKRMNELAKEATLHSGYKILAPLMNFDKDMVVSLGEELKVPWKYTYSCYGSNGFRKGVPVHCGTCSNCRLRQTGFYWSNIQDPSIYEQIYKH